MTGATAALLVNVLLAAVIAAAFGTLQARMRTAPWWQSFAGSYLVGTLTPLSELLLRFGVAEPVFRLVSFGSFLLAFLLFCDAVARYLHVRIPPIILPTVFICGLALRLLIWNGQRDELLYELCYQAPFAAALSLSCVVVASAARGRFGERLLALLLGFTAMHFLAKAVIASVVRSGDTAVTYYTSQYALVSQSATAVLMVAVALTTMGVMIRDAFEDAVAQAETDALSGLLNRRGFDRRATASLGTGEFTALMCDLDHFKRVNDTLGHAFGDQVIKEFAAVARKCSVQGSIVGRTGGEEFSLLVPEGIDRAVEIAETIAREQKIASERAFGRPVTISIGVVTCGAGGLAETMRRADHELYRAKAAGRDRVAVEGRLWPASEPSRRVETFENGPVRTA